MNKPPSLWEIALYFAALSLIAFGGANAVLPDMHRELVEVRGWMSSGEFAALTALAQAAPGPNVLVVSLLGWKLAGLKGALTATVAMCLPCSLLTYFFARGWQRFRHRVWQRAVQTGLASVTIGLILASGYVLARAADHHWGAYAVTMATAVLIVKTDVHPLCWLAVAGLLGFAGVI